MGEESDHVQLVALTDALQVRASALSGGVARCTPIRQSVGRCERRVPALHSAACTRTLAQVPVRVVYLDRSLAPGGGSSVGSVGVHVDMHDFVPGERQRAAVGGMPRALA